MNAPIVNVRHFWPALEAGAHANSATPAQIAAIRALEKLVKDRVVNFSTFAETTTVMIEGILSITARECGDNMKLIANGAWFRLAIEEDGYTVLTGSTIPVPLSGNPEAMT